MDIPLSGSVAGHTNNCGKTSRLAVSESMDHHDGMVQVMSFRVSVLSHVHGMYSAQLRARGLHIEYGHEDRGGKRQIT